MDWFIVGFGGVICAFLFMPGRVQDIGSYRIAFLCYFARFGAQAAGNLSTDHDVDAFFGCVSAAALIASAWFLLRAILGKKS